MNTWGEGQAGSWMQADGREKKRGDGLAGGGWRVGWHRLVGSLSLSRSLGLSLPLPFSHPLFCYFVMIGHNL